MKTFVVILCSVLFLLPVGCGSKEKQGDSASSTATSQPTTKAKKSDDGGW